MRKNKMENKTRRIYNKIEKICLVGIISGLSCLSVETLSDYYQNKNNITTHKLITLGLLDLVGLACVGYSLSLRKYKKEY